MECCCCSAGQSAPATRAILAVVESLYVFSKLWLSGGQALVNHTQKMRVLQSSGNTLLVIQLLVHLVLRRMAPFGDLQQHTRISPLCSDVWNEDGCGQEEMCMMTHRYVQLVRLGQLPHQLSAYAESYQRG